MKGLSLTPERVLADCLDALEHVPGAGRDGRLDVGADQLGDLDVAQVLCGRIARARLALVPTATEVNETEARWAHLLGVAL